MSEVKTNSFFYLVVYPESSPDRPQYISYTFLSRMSECGYKFYLEEGNYAFATKYPKILNVAQVQGILIHKLIEHMMGFINRGQASSAGDAILMTNPRAYLKSEIEVLNLKLKKNPRVNAINLISNLSVDQIINYSKKWLFSSEIHSKSHSSRNSSEKGNVGSEAVIKIDSPPLMGVLDLYTDETILDFKTGARSESHIEQGRFYALLWFLKYGKLPKNIKLLYLSDKTEVIVPVPSVSELKLLQEEILEKVSRIDAQFSSSNFIPSYDFDNCRRCGVRHLCDTYWKNSQNENFGSKDFLDVIFDFDEKFRFPESSGVSINERNYSLYIDRSFFPPGAIGAKQVRVLNLMRDSNDSSKLRFLKNTEVFWKIE